ncbi:hypothetical protein CGRA01v4_10370 [Colletotrichum graminicola]|nr:hypothetical protein CGRA01v4_10370 [Colletotrichum graminicola]
MAENEPWIGAVSCSLWLPPHRRTGRCPDRNGIVTLLVSLTTISSASLLAAHGRALLSRKASGGLSRSRVSVLGVPFETALLGRGISWEERRGVGGGGVDSFVLMSSEEMSSWRRTMPQRQPMSRKHRLFAWLPMARKQRLSASCTPLRRWWEEWVQGKPDFLAAGRRRARRHEIDKICKQVFVAQVECLRPPTPTSNVLVVAARCILRWTYTRCILCPKLHSTAFPQASSALTDYTVVFQPPRERSRAMGRAKRLRRR